MTRVSSREEAEQLVADIAIGYGHVPEKYQQELQKVSPGAREAFNRVISESREAIDGPIIALAKNLYTSDTRFVFEILQNCDGNSYTKACQRGEKPTVSFNISHDRIVIDCNEDGFTVDNVKALCRIGKSSKAGSQEQIGEKGIGFKSVFKIAYKVVIQSGFLCFSFTHHKGDSGAGMITPTWEQALPMAPAGKTILTLWLRNSGNSDDMSSNIRTQLTQFESIQEEMLLFTRNLARINVEFDDSAGASRHKVSYECVKDQGSTVSTKRFQWTGSSAVPLSWERKFHLYTYTAMLPRNGNRQYGEQALATPSWATCQIALAFPLTEIFEPVLKNQWLFSFLPITQVALKFIIHADFLTWASRRGIESGSFRNIAIGKAIPRAFVGAISEMCQHPTLQYQWMRFLPSLDADTIWNPFLSTVIRGIDAELGKVDVLRPASLGALKRIQDMRCTSDFLDQHGDPLLPDITPECYLSQKYATSDLAILRRHGLEMLSTTEFLHRVQSDLDPDRLSRMRSSIDADWHRRVARALQRPFLDKIGLPISSIRGMALVPLTDGSWQSTSDTTCYYAHVDGLEIPRGLGLSLVEPQASTQPERKRLFDFLGVKTATIAMIRQRIYDCYQTPIRDMSFTRSLSHLRFLYLTHQKAAANNRTGRDGIFSIGVLADMGEKWWCYTNPLTTDVYMPSDDPLSASQLLAPTPKSPERDDGAPGLPVHILDTGYLNDPPERPSADSPSWIDWLHDTMHIRRHIRLKNASANQMSRLAAYVAEHRPKKFTSLLKTLWPFQRGELVNSFGFLYELNRTLVLTRGNHHMYLLCNTFLPTRHLLDLAKRFFPDDDFFPWISLETEVVAQEQEWQQLVADTGTLLPKDDLAFVLKCLSGSWLPVASRFTGLDVDVVPKGIFDLYCFLEGQHKMSANKEEVSSRIRYSMTSGILVPGDDGFSWVGPHQCIWEAPVSNMRARYTLCEFYDRPPGRESTTSSGHQSLHSFFRDIVAIATWGWETAVEELEHQSEHGADFDHILDLYKWLGNSEFSDEEDEGMRRAFEDKPLIYKPSETEAGPDWHKSTDCLWTSVTGIPGKKAINNDGDYDGLETFFARTLGVQRMTLRMLYDKLRNTGQGASVGDVRNDLIEFNALLAAETLKDNPMSRPASDSPRPKKQPKSLDPVALWKAPIFPVRRPDGQRELVGGQSSFHIVDRELLEDYFRNKATLLDFTMDEARSLKPLIQWIGLDNRYLSTSVREISTAETASTRPISEPTRQISKKAGSLLSIAIACSSPRVSKSYGSLYQTLRGSKTLETERITTSITLSDAIDGRPVTHEKHDGIATHVDDTHQGLCVYVPRRLADREGCFFSKLPERLLEWLVSDPVSGVPSNPQGSLVTVVSAIINAHPCSLSGILKEHGISQAPSQYPDDDADEDDQSTWRTSTPTPDTSSVPDSSTDNTRAPGRAPVSANRSPVSVYEETTVVEVSSAAYAPGQAAPHAGTRTLIQHMSQQGYHRLLEHVVSRARSFAFVSQDPFGMAAIGEALSDQVGAIGPDMSFLNSFDEEERNNMIGAAGELFVFELLQRQQEAIPGFTRDNWTSFIRHYVQGHPEYNDIEGWSGSGLANIVYQDTTGAFTDFLVDTGYLATFDNEMLRQSAPWYLIDVETTPRGYETPFFMSKYQYWRMQKHTQSAQNDGESPTVYLIMRVFNLGKPSVSVKVLVDPEGMRRREELVFEAVDRWSVLPFPELGFGLVHRWSVRPALPAAQIN